MIKGKNISDEKWNEFWKDVGALDDIMTIASSINFSPFDQDFARTWMWQKIHDISVSSNALLKDRMVNEDA